MLFKIMIGRGCNGIYKGDKVQDDINFKTKDVEVGKEMIAEITLNNL